MNGSSRSSLYKIMTGLVCKYICAKNDLRTGEFHCNATTAIYLGALQKVLANLLYYWHTKIHTVLFPHSPITPLKFSTEKGDISTALPEAQSLLQHINLFGLSRNPNAI